jgi:hypothetical protein
MSILHAKAVLRAAILADVTIDFWVLRSGHMLNKCISYAILLKVLDFSHPTRTFELSDLLEPVFIRVES